MLVRRCWFDLKPRFFWATGFFLFFSANMFFLYYKMAGWNESGALSNSTGLAAYLATGSLKDYSFFVDQCWFYGTLAYFEFFAIVLAWGGILVHKQKTDILMALSLPVKRSHWLMAHGGITACLLFILIFVFTISFLAVSHIIGKYYPLDTALAKALLIWLACLPWIGLSLLANSFLNSGFRSMMVLIVVFTIFYQFRTTYYITYHSFLTSDLQIAFSWADLLAITMATIGTTGLAIWKFGKNEY
jgi:hypothetical protein